MSKTMRDLLTALLPNGGVWDAAPDDDLDKFLDGMAANHEVMRSYLATLAHLRDPHLTQMLKDLEREYGLVTNTEATEIDRRIALASQKSAKAGTGSAGQLQQKLQNAGFDLYVHENNGPVINPMLWMFDGELIVNGDQYYQEIEYVACAGRDDTCAGNDSAVAGHFTFAQQLIEYEIPPGIILDIAMVADSDIAYAGNDFALAGFRYPNTPVRWNYIFYVGGPVTTWGDPIDFDRGQVPAEKKEILKRMILQHKPMHSWCGLVVDYI